MLLLTTVEFMLKRWPLEESGWLAENYVVGFSAPSVTLEMEEGTEVDLISSGQ